MDKFIGMAKNEMKLTMDIQFPIPLAHKEIFRRPYSSINLSLIIISSKFVRKENRGAKGNATAKKAMKPIWMIPSLYHK